METKVLYKGVKVELQNMELVLPPLNLTAFYMHNAGEKIERIFKTFTEIQSNASFGNITKEIIEDVVDVVELSAKRNYPTITREQIMDGLDILNMAPVIMAIMVQNQDQINEAAIKKNGRK